MNKTIYILVISMVLLLHQTSSARGWVDYVKDKGLKPGESDRISEIYDSKKQPFKDLVKHWQKKEVQEQQIVEYGKYGINKALATKAINERLRTAKMVINTNFDHRNISPILDNLDNRVATINYIAILGHDRFKKLIEKYEMKVDDGFYQCLCRSKGIMGSGMGYSPAPDKHCNNADPCKGGNWGCASSNLPKQGDSWMSCAKRYPLENGSNIFQAFDEHVNTRNKFNHNDLVRKLFDRSLKFKDLCLPSMDAKNIEDIQNISKIEILRKAVDISEGAENACEEAIAVSLYLNSEKRITNDDAALEFVAIWTLPTNTADKAGFALDYGRSFLNVQNKLTKLAGNNLPIISNLMNISSSIELYKRVSTEQKIDSQHKEAYAIFRDSKNMTLEEINEYEQIFHKKLETLKDRVKTSDARFLDQLESRTSALQGDLELMSHGKQLNINKDLQQKVKERWKRFTDLQEERKKDYEKEKAKNITQYTELLMYKNVLTEYRKPLKKLGCKKFLNERQKHCGSRGLKFEQR